MKPSVRAVRQIFLILTAWFFFAPAHAAKAATLSDTGAGFQVAENTEEEEHEHHNYRHDQSHEKNDRDRYNDSDYSEWYWGQRGRWYRGNNGWQFRSSGLVRNNFGTIASGDATYRLMDKGW